MKLPEDAASSASNQQAMTVLYRANGAWTFLEVSKLSNALSTTVNICDAKPEFIVLQGRFTPDKIQQACPSEVPCIVTHVTEQNSLPF